MTADTHNKGAQTPAAASAHVQQGLPMRNALHLPPGACFEHIQADGPVQIHGTVHARIHGGISW